MFCTFDYYRDAYGGRAIAEADWTQAEMSASAFVDRLTFRQMSNVCKTQEDVPDELRNAVCAVADRKAEIDSTGGLVSSETTSKHSVTYHRQQEQTADMELRSAAMTYLAGTKWVYRGVRHERHCNYH